MQVAVTSQMAGSRVYSNGSNCFVQVKVKYGSPVSPYASVAQRLPCLEKVALWVGDCQIRRLARAYVLRTPGLGASAVSAVVGRWSARLSAALLRGNAFVLRGRGGLLSFTP